MMSRCDGRWLIQSPMLMASAKALLADGCEKLSMQSEVFDLSVVREVDSSALAVMLGWKRFAKTRGFQVGFYRAPDSIRVLADLYGLTALLLEA